MSKKMYLVVMYNYDDGGADYLAVLNNKEEAEKIANQESGDWCLCKVIEVERFKTAGGYFKALENWFKEVK